VSDVPTEAVRFPDMTVACCRRHLLELCPEHHPSGLSWQVRWVVVATEMLKLVYADQRIQERIGTEFTPTVATVVLEEASPLCCFLEPGVFGTLRETIVSVIARMKRRELDT
jgi:hypothetical protein